MKYRSDFQNFSFLNKSKNTKKKKKNFTVKNVAVSFL